MCGDARSLWWPVAVPGEDGKRRVSGREGLKTMSVG